MSSPSVIREVAANMPLPLVAGFMAFVDQYGSAILFVIGVSYGLCQWYWRRKEHKKLMGDK